MTKHFLRLVPLLALAGCSAGGAPISEDQEAFTLNQPYQPRYTSQLSTRGRWPTRTLRVGFSAGAETRSLEELRPVMEQAMQRWIIATGGMVNFTFVANPDEAEIHLTFVGPSDPDLPPTVRDQAVTNLEWLEGSPRDTLTSALIKVRAGLPAKPLASIVAHEVGHALGITGHSNSAGDLMATRFATGTSVSRRDASTLAFLYLTDERD